jgi:hypothetical protein
MTTTTDDIIARYISINPDVQIDDREELKQNLQADINKVEGIIRKLTDKKAPVSELERLRVSVINLVYTIDIQIEELS